MKKVERMEITISVLDCIIWIGQSVLYFASVLGAAYKLMTAHTIFPVGKESAVQHSDFIATIILIITICLVIILIKSRPDQTSISKIICFSVSLGIFISFMIFCFFLCSEYRWFITLCMGLLILFTTRKILKWIKDKIERNSEEGETRQ